MRRATLFALSALALASILSLFLLHVFALRFSFRGGGLPRERARQRSTFNCTRWNVVAATSAPSTAAKRAASLPGWCTVVVADARTPKNYLKTAGFEWNSSTVHFLSVADQERWARDAGGAIGGFLSAVPRGHPARKNVGYLHAVRHGARWLRDLDEDDPSSEDAATFGLLPNDTHLENVNVVALGPNAFNYHKINGLTANDAPRGFPRDLVRNPATGGSVAYGGATRSLESIAVMQRWLWGSADAAKRRPPGPLLVPPHAFVPYDARGTVHAERALWALFLPSTVPGGASDVWRGYFAQALFRDLGLQVAVVPHLEAPGRKERDHRRGGEDASLDSYFGTGAEKLIEFLSSWRSAAETVPERMKELWVELNEHGFIELNDVHGVQLWLQALTEIGYVFPKPKRPERIDNVVLMGQCNSDLLDIVFWTQKWRTWFSRIVVRGPFNDEMLRQLRDHGIVAYAARRDKGVVSPMENLMLTLKEFSNHSDVVGVLYVHDDALLNVGRLLYQSLIQGRDVMITHSGKGFFSLRGDGTYKLMNGTSVKTKEGLLSSLIPWYHWKDNCIPPLWNVYKDPRSIKYHEADGSFMVAKGQSDFMYVPTKYSEEFEWVARLMVEHGVFLECGFPKITDMLRGSANATIRQVSLCTSWYGGIRGTPAMVEQCGGYEKSAMYHPIKLKEYGYQRWSDAFDAVK